MQNLEYSGPILDLSDSAEVARFLEPVVCDLVALAVNGKHAHWHVRGINFLPIHEYLDEVVSHAQDASDELAERIVALGQPVDARLGEVAKNTRTAALTEGFVGVEQTIQEIVSQIDTVRRTADVAIRGLDDLDLVSQDLVIAHAHQLDKDRWFLNSHLLGA